MPGPSRAINVAAMSDYNSDGSMSAKFWATFMGCIVLGCIGAAILFLLFGKAWEAWGGFVAMLVALAIVIGIAALVDRGRMKRYGGAGV